MKNLTQYATSICALAVVACSIAVDCLAKGTVWTVEARSEKLMQEINDGQKNGELTLKEAQQLRSDLAEVAHRKHKLTGNDAGKMSDDDKNTIEKMLNKVSTKLKKLELAKRVNSK
jgi:polyhydroxyalkanoate synthesis regulator phasin